MRVLGQPLYLSADAQQLIYTGLQLLFAASPALDRDILLGFEHFALQLLGALAHLALRGRELLAGIIELLLQLRLLI